MHFGPYQHGARQARPDRATKSLCGGVSASLRGVSAIGRWPIVRTPEAMLHFPQGGLRIET
eukprot:12542936-Alexandrium_andersonii.AAC.1